jgi:hypothetical protein
MTENEIATKVADAVSALCPRCSLWFSFGCGLTAALYALRLCVRRLFASECVLDDVSP